ncbi:Sulfotransferase domain-containing protein [Microdochium nivale]|nr:Sulfotransferase domain-containing protein [Microdochium nivale]
MGAVPSVPRDRSRKLQVIGAGYGRTGTTAISLAIERLYDGPVMHGGTQMIGREDAYMKKLVDLHKTGTNKPRLLYLLREITAGFVGITDCPGILFIPELMELYPDAKVVLVTRDPEKWWKSIEPVAKNVSFWWLKPLLFPLPGLRWVPELMEGMVLKNRTLYGMDMKPGIDLLASHNAHVRKVVPKDRLLEMQISDGWAPLCAFLGKPIPNEPFPRSNDAAATEQRFKEAVLNALVIWAAIISFTFMGMYVVWSIWALSHQEQPLLEIVP